MQSDSWCAYSCRWNGREERLFIYPLGEKEQFMFGTPNFSRNEERRIKFLGVFDDGVTYHGAPQLHVYDFILGSEEGSGAFSFPTPCLVMPYRTVEEAEEFQKRVEEKMEKAQQASRRPGLQESRDAIDWIEFNRKFRPYEGFYVGEPHKPLPSHQFDISELKSVAEQFKKPLTATCLPPEFVAGVVDIISSELYEFCERCCIPTIRVRESWPPLRG